MNNIAHFPSLQGQREDHIQSNGRFSDILSNFEEKTSEQCKKDNSRIRLELEGPNELKKCLEASEGFGCLDETENLPKLNASSRISQDELGAFQTLEGGMKQIDDLTNKLQVKKSEQLQDNLQIMESEHDNSESDETRERESKFISSQEMRNESSQDQLSHQTIEEEEHANNSPPSYVDGLSVHKTEEKLISSDISQNMIDENGRFRIVSEDEDLNVPCLFLGTKSTQLTNVNDASRLFSYFFGAKMQRLLLKRANQNIIELASLSNLKDFSFEEISVFIALKIVMGLQQNSTSPEFFLLNDLQTLPAYANLFSNERFSFLIDCEMDLNKEILSNDQIVSDFASRAQNAQTSDQELAFVIPGIANDDANYTAIYLCEVNSCYVFGYYLTKDVGKFAKEILQNLENFTNFNHHIFLSSQLQIMEFDQIPELLKQRIHLSTILQNGSNALPQELKDHALTPNQRYYDTITQTQFVVNGGMNGGMNGGVEHNGDHLNKEHEQNNVYSQKKLDTHRNRDRHNKGDLSKKGDELNKGGIFLTTNGSLMQQEEKENMLEKHKRVINEIFSQMDSQLVQQRFINIGGQSSIFEEITEIAIQNSFIIYKQEKGKIDYREFRLKLARELLSKQIQRLSQQEIANKKQNITHSETQTDQTGEIKQTTNNEKEPNKIQLQPTTPNCPASYRQQQQSGLPGQNNQWQYLHRQRKNEKKGICLLCLQENNFSNYTFISCSECDSLNPNQIYLCGDCFGVYHSKPDELQVDIQGEDRLQFTRLNTLKPGPYESTSSIPYTNGRALRGRKPGQDAYDAASVQFQSSQLPNILPKPFTISHLKRRGVPIEDSGFRSDSHSGFVPGPAARGRKRIHPQIDGYQRREEYSAYEPPYLQQGYPPYQGHNGHGFTQQQPPDLNGIYEPNFGRSHYPPTPQQQQMVGHNDLRK